MSRDFYVSQHTLKQYDFIIVSATLSYFQDNFKIFCYACPEVIFMPTSQTSRETVCGTCAHFYKHYIKRGKRYYPLIFGHCVFPRFKDRKETDHCPYWTARTP